MYGQPEAISPDLIDAFEDVVEFADYNLVSEVLKDELIGKKLLVEKSELSVWLLKTLESVDIQYGRSPISRPSKCRL